MTRQDPNIGIDQVRIAQVVSDLVATADPIYATPIRIEGAVSGDYNPASELSNFYADDGIFVVTSRAGTIQQTLTLSNLDAETYALLLGATYDSASGQIIESVNDVALKVALGWRSQISDGLYEYNWLKAGYFAKPLKNQATKAETITYSTTPLIFNAIPQLFGSRFRNWFNSNDDNFPVGLTDALLINESTGWASDPNYLPVAPGTPIADFAVVTGSGAGELDATWTAAVGASLVKIQVLDPVSGDYNDATTAAAIAVGDALATITGLTTGNTYTARLVVTGGTNNGVSNTDSAAAL